MIDVLPEVVEGWRRAWTTASTPGCRPPRHRRVIGGDVPLVLAAVEHIGHRALPSLMVIARARAAPVPWAQFGHVWFDAGSVADIRDQALIHRERARRRLRKPLVANTRVRSILCFHKTKDFV